MFHHVLVRSRNGRGCNFQWTRVKTIATHVPVHKKRGFGTAAWVHVAYVRKHQPRRRGRAMLGYHRRPIAQSAAHPAQRPARAPLPKRDCPCAAVRRKSGVGVGAQNRPQHKRGDNGDDDHALATHHPLNSCRTAATLLRVTYLEMHWNIYGLSLIHI